MPLAAKVIRLIEAPDWASVRTRSVDNDFDPVAFAAIQDARCFLMSAVRHEVIKYLSDPQLCFDDDNFPSTKRLNGDYYIGDESYIWHAEEEAFHISVMANFLGESLGPRSPDDYLSLEVHLQWLPCSASFVSWRNTDSSVI